MNGRPRLAYYADDFTGATDVLDTFARRGVPSILYFDIPSDDDLQEGLPVVGLAGQSRSMSPRMMGRELQRAFTALKALDPILAQYKVCSTFDSAPSVGSIGLAAEIAANTFGNGPIPVMGGTPHLGRYCVFGNLFARAPGDGPPWRLDRHPSLASHPTTPMGEADLRHHMARQTKMPIHLRDVLQLHGPMASESLGRLFAKEKRTSLFLCDSLTYRDSDVVGLAIWNAAEAGIVRFAIGPSGLDEALAAAWHFRGAAQPTTSAVGVMLTVSGTCAGVTANQVATAAAMGHVVVDVDPTDRADGWRRALDRARSSIARGSSVIVQTCGRKPTGRPAIGARLGRLAEMLVDEFDLSRIVVCGGDTSGAVARRLGLYSGRVIATIAPGAPLLAAIRLNAKKPIEIALKGGQIGPPDYIERVRLGRETPQRL